MSIIVGTEKKIVFLNVHKPAPVAQATVNVIGVFSVKKAITEQKINKIEDVTGLTSDDDIYKILQAVFNGGAQEVLIYLLLELNQEILILHNLQQPLQLFHHFC